MTLQDLGSLGEFIAALATLATLGYLAMQIRQNTQAVRGSAARESLALLNDAVRPIVTNDELSSLTWRGMTDPDSLSDEESGRVYLFLYSLIAVFQTLFMQREQGILDPRIFEQQTKALLTYLTFPGGVRWRQATAEDFDPAFRAFIDTRLASLREPRTGWQRTRTEAAARPG